LRQLTQIDAEPSCKLADTQTELRSVLTSDMAPVICFVTSGDAHHEEAIQGRFGDRYFSVFLLLSHHRYQFDLCSRFGADSVLRAWFNCAAEGWIDQATVEAVSAEIDAWSVRPEALVRRHVLRGNRMGE